MAGVAVDPTLYEVRTRFRVMRNVPGLNNVGRQVSGLNRQFNNLVRSAAVIGLGIGITRGTQALIEMQTEIQNAEVGIGSIVSALTQTDMTTSLRAATGLVRELRRDAARTPGELRDFALGLQQILAPTLAAGGSLGRARELNRLALLAGVAINPQRGLTTIPFDVSQALTQGTGVRTTRDLNIALRAIQVSNEAFNAMTRPERLATLERAFGTFTEAAEVMGRTWDAQTATLKDNIKEVARSLTRPIFESMSQQLIEVNDWLQRNEESTKAWASAVGKDLGAAFDRILEKLPQIARRTKDITLTIGAVGAGAVLGRSAGFGVARLAGVAGGPIAAVFTFLGALLGRAAQKWPDLSAKLGRSLTRLGASLGRLVEGLGRLLLDNPLSEFIGRELLISLDDAVGGLARLVEGLAALTEGVNEFLNLLPTLPEAPRVGVSESIDKINEGFATLFGPSGILFSGGTARFDAQGRPIVSGGRGLESFMSQRALDMLPPEPDPDFRIPEPEPEISGTPVVNINGPVTIVVRAEKVDNPDLAARSFGEAMRRINEFRVRGRTTLFPRPL